MTVIQAFMLRLYQCIQARDVDMIIHAGWIIWDIFSSSLAGHTVWYFPLIIEVSVGLYSKGLVINYGEGGATKQEVGGGHVKFYPYEKGGGRKKFCSRFFTQLA